MKPDIAAIRERAEVIFHWTHGLDVTGFLGEAIMQCSSQDIPALLSHIESLEGLGPVLADLSDWWKAQANASREEAGRIRRTIKAATDAEERCNVRAEIWDECAKALTTKLALYRALEGKLP